MVAYSALIIDYLGEGLAADRPATIDIAPGVVGFYYATDTKALSLWNSTTGTWDAGGTGTVVSVAAGTGLEVGAGPGGTITSTGTLNLVPATTAALGGVLVGHGLAVSGGTLTASSIAAGVLSSNGTVAEATTLGAGLNWSAATLSNTGVVLFGGAGGTIVLGPNLSMTGQTLEVAAGAGGVTSLVAGLGLAGGTITSTGTVTLDVATTAALGGVIVGSGVTVNGGGTISVAAAGVTSVVAGSGLNVGAGPGGTISTAGTLNVAPATTAALGGVVAGSGVTIDPGGTISVAPGGVTSIGGDTGSIAVGGGLSAASNTLSNTGVLAVGAAAGSIVLGPNLSMSGQTLEVASGAGGVTAVVAGTGLTGGTITTSGTLALGIATTAALGGIIVGSGATINGGGTLSVASPGTGTVTSVVAGSGLGGGTISAAGTITNAGVLAIGATAGSIALGAHLAMTGSTLDTSGYGTMALQNSNSVSITGGTITGMPSPSAGTDVANKAYVDAAIVGIDFKPTAIVATTTALASNTYLTGVITLVGTGATTIDGHVLVANDLVLIKNEGTASHNGLYNVTTAGTTGIATVLTRNASMNQSSELAGAFVPVDNVGTVNANSLWISNPTTPATIDVTAIPFTQLNAPTSFVQGAGIGISGNTISNTGVIQFGTDAGTIHVGSGLAEASNTLNVTAATTSALGGVIAGSGVTINAGGTISTSGLAAPGAGLVSSNGTTLEVTTLAGATWSNGTLTVTGTSSPFLLAMAGANARFVMGGLG